MCERAWALSGKTPNCEQCIPALLPENKEVFDIFTTVQNQHIMGFGGPVDLNFQSVEFIMNLNGVENKKEMFSKVYKLYKLSLKFMREKSERGDK